MQEFPHIYYASANGQKEGTIFTQSDDLPTIESAAPVQFNGPGDKWSPEEMLVGAIANCFILTFRAISNLSKLEWRELTCDVNGKLEKIDRKIKFTTFDLNASLEIISEDDVERAKQMLEKAEQNCLITNSLTASVSLNTKIIY